MIGMAGQRVTASHLARRLCFGEGTAGGTAVSSMVIIRRDTPLTYETLAMRPTTLVMALLLIPAGQSLAAEPVVIARPEAFQTLVNPACSRCRDEAKRRAGELQTGDRVLCWIRGYSDGGAIPCVLPRSLSRDLGQLRRVRVRPRGRLCAGIRPLV